MRGRALAILILIIFVLLPTVFFIVGGTPTNGQRESDRKTTNLPNKLLSP